MYDVINCLTKNLITHLIWYLEKEKRYGIETLSIDRVLSKEHFYGQSIKQSYVLSEQVWWCNIKRFLSYSKNYICKFMQANSWHHKFFHFHLSFWIWKVWKGREKLQKFEYLEKEKGFLDEIKNIFHIFWRSIVWWKNKNLTKNSGHKL